MQGFDWTDFWATLTPQTVIAVAITGLAVGMVLIPQEVPRGRHLHRAMFSLTLGTAFQVTFAAGRWFGGEPTWEKPLGTTLLWWLFIGIAFGVDALVRRRNGVVL